MRKRRVEITLWKWSFSVASASVLLLLIPVYCCCCSCCCCCCCCPVVSCAFSWSVRREVHCKLSNARVLFSQSPLLCHKSPFTGRSLRLRFALPASYTSAMTEPSPDHASRLLVSSSHGLPSSSGPLLAVSVSLYRPLSSSLRCLTRSVIEL